jgi:GTP-binding protein
MESTMRRTMPDGRSAFLFYLFDACLSADRVFCYATYMKILSATFIKGLTEDDEILFDGTPQIAFLGRSNVGKSSVINSIVQRKDLAFSSPTPGLTKVVNVFHINKSFYLIDVPGYGFAKGSKDARSEMQRIITWYALHPVIEQKKIILIIDAKVGVTESDAEMLGMLEEAGKDVIIVANKIDKLKKNELKPALEAIADRVHPYPIIPYSATEKIGVGELIKAIS